jgi:hypothetical protein
MTNSKADQPLNDAALVEQNHDLKSKCEQVTKECTELKLRSRNCTCGAFQDSKNTALDTTTELPSLAVMGMTANCVASVPDTQVMVCPWGGAKVYSLEVSAEIPTWSPISVPHSPVWNVFEWNNLLCIRVGMNNNMYCWKNDCWDYLANSPQNTSMSKGSSSILSIENLIYRFGGHNGEALNRALVYHPQKGKWTNLPPMPFHTFWGSTAWSDGRIYVGGGYVDKHGDCHPINDMAALDIRTKRWQRVSPLPHRNATIAALSDQIISSGGSSDYNADHDDRSVFWLECRMHHWIPMTSMKHARMCHGTCLWPTDLRKLVVAGGRHNNTVELITMV